METNNKGCANVYGLGHGYLVNAVYARCECGAEILEISQCDFDEENGYTYQIRAFGRFTGSRRDNLYSYIEVDRTGIVDLIEALSGGPEAMLYSEDCPEYYLCASRDLFFDLPENGAYSVSFERFRRLRRKSKCLYEIIISEATASSIVAELKYMLTVEEEVYGKKI